MIDLVLGVAGPILPSDKSLTLMAGDGYIVGYFIASLLLPDMFDLRPSTLSLEEVRETEARNEIRYRRGGALFATVLLVVWAIGAMLDPAQYPVFPPDENLFGAIPMLGLAGLGAALYANLAVRQVKEAQMRVVAEHKVGESMAQLASVVLFTGYVVAWVRPF